MPASHLPVNFFFDLLLLLILTGMGLNVTRFILPGCGGATLLAATGVGLYLFSVTIFALTALAFADWNDDLARGWWHDRALGADTAAATVSREITVDIAHREDLAS